MLVVLTTPTLPRDGLDLASQFTDKAQLFWVFTCDQPRSPSARIALADVDEVRLGRGDGFVVRSPDAGGAREMEILVPDRWMSGDHARLRRDLGRWMLDDRDSKNGTFVNGVKTRESALRDGDVVELGHSFFLYRAAMRTRADDPAVLRSQDLQVPDPGLATLHPGLAHELSSLVQVIPSPTSVVLLGESGTGKEVLARAIHRLSGRQGPFVAVNCGALPETLVESELYGYRKGAFSDAREDRPGLVRSAHMGTLFLDEIGDLPEPAQAAFLRVLQEREVVPVGTAQPIRVDFRLIAATHRDLAAEVCAKRFRADLFARLQGFALRLLPLRERREDLGLLLRELTMRLAGDRADRVAFTFQAARALFAQTWPGNVRELEKCLGAALALARSDTLGAEHLFGGRVGEPAAVGGRAAAAALAPAPVGKDDARRVRLLALLEEHEGNVAAVARELQTTRMQVHRLARRYQIAIEDYRPGRTDENGDG
jgi:DNA-binding NtrC family response regulator